MELGTSLSLAWIRLRRVSLSQFNSEFHGQPWARLRKFWMYVETFERWIVFVGIINIQL